MLLEPRNPVIGRQANAWIMLHAAVSSTAEEHVSNFQPSDGMWSDFAEKPAGFWKARSDSCISHFWLTWSIVVTTTTDGSSKCRVFRGPLDEGDSRPRQSGCFFRRTRGIRAGEVMEVQIPHSLAWRAEGDVIRLSTLRFLLLCLDMAETRKLENIKENIRSTRDGKRKKERKKERRKRRRRRIWQSWETTPIMGRYKNNPPPLRVCTWGKMIPIGV